LEANLVRLLRMRALEEGDVVVPTDASDDCAAECLVVGGGEETETPSVCFCVRALNCIGTTEVMKDAIEKGRKSESVRQQKKNKKKKKEFFKRPRIDNL
jgi:hypothetical protein